MCVTVLFAVSCRLPCRVVVWYVCWGGDACSPTYLVETIVHFRIDWKQYEAQPNLFEMAWKGRYILILTRFDMRIWISISELSELEEVDC